MAEQIRTESSAGTEVTSETLKLSGTLETFLIKQLRFILYKTIPVNIQNEGGTFVMERNIYLTDGGYTLHIDNAKRFTLDEIENKEEHFVIITT